MSRKNINVRLGENKEGHIIRDIVVGTYGDLWSDFDWTNIKPYWLVAEVDGEIKGCIQIFVGKPISMLEFLCFKKEVADGERALIIKALSKFGLTSLYGSGASAVVGTVPFFLKSWKKVLKRQWNGVIVSSGNVFMKRFV